jgi:DNA-binding response OmpR family regulator
MINGRAILIVEDNADVAMNLTMAVEDIGGRVIGPIDRVDDALKLVVDGSVGAAILDCQLGDRDVTPLALHLIQRGVPVVFYTGTAVPSAVLEVYPTVPVVLKPAQPDTVLLALFAEITGR